MEIKLAKTAGFCFGVNRAVKITEALAKESDVYTIGPLIHNKEEVQRLHKLGIKVCNDTDELTEKDTVVIRSHGIPFELENQLLSRNIKVVDATCPFVKKIHNIVKEHYNKGYKIVIVGDSRHAEVIGINGQCDNTAVILSTPEEVETKIKGEDRLCMVAQTTFDRFFWEKIINITKNYCKDITFFDTICKATNERQTEAEKLSRECEAMVIIGGRNSSNTTKLANICRRNCDKVLHIENASELEQFIRECNVVGVTAGASAPDWIIKEVLNTMEEISKGTELSFEEELKNSLVTLNTGDIVKGTVIGITPTEVYVDLGYKSDGVMSVSEISDLPDEKVEDVIKVGDEIEAYVYRVSDVDGVVGLSMKRLKEMKGWIKVQEAFENKQDLTGKIVEKVNGGVIAVAEGARIFIPASQANDRYLSDLGVLVGKTVPIRIRDVNQSRRKVIGSVKDILVEEKAKKSQEFWAKVDAGQTEFDGTVKTITNFGAFVDIGGVDGLVHISELSWNHIKHPSEVLKEGETVKVILLEANRETGKISLGYRRAEDNPWTIAQEKFHVGDTVTVKVVRLVPFGAFVEMMPGIDGLIHISQIANKRIGKTSDELSVGQEVEAKITEIDAEAKKIALSIRALLPEEAPAEAPAEEAAPAEETATEE